MSKIPSVAISVLLISEATAQCINDGLTESAVATIIHTMPRPDLLQSSPLSVSIEYMVPC